MSPAEIVVRVVVIAFFAWMLIYGAIFHEKGPTYEFFARLFRR